MINNKVILYGLGKRFEEESENLKKYYNVIGYSDKNIEKRKILENPQEFVEWDRLLEKDFNKIIVTGGGENARKQLYYFYMNDLEWEDIILLEQARVEGGKRERFDRDISEYQRTLILDQEFKYDSDNLWPIVHESCQEAGMVDAHYFMQDIVVARKILENNPEKHYDVGSRLDGFISHLLVFRKQVTVIDVRPLAKVIEGLDFICADATVMEGIEDNSIESLSSLHALEHFGLGRYGDKVNGDAWITALKSFERVMKPKGMLYLSVPCGSKNQIYFNAHRVFNPHTIINHVKHLDLLRFEAIQNYKSIEVDIFDKKCLEGLGDYYAGIFTF